MRHKRPEMSIVVYPDEVWMESAFAELAKDALTIEGYDVLGAYMSPVSDHYSKKVPFFSLSQNHASDLYADYLLD